MAEVVVELQGEEVLRVPLKGASMTIGRDPQCDVHLDNRALSRRHAQIEKRGAAIWVRDLNSQNGTYVNGNKVGEPLALSSGDVVEVGRYQLRIHGVEDARQDTPVLTLTGPEGRHRFAMVGDEIVIGRAPSCDIAIGHKSISRRHLRIGLDGDHFVAEDLGSQNGTRLNGRRINGPTPFARGEKLQMSDFTIEVGFLEQAAENPGREKRNKTMMIDRSDLAKAAYVDGDAAANPAAGSGNISLGSSNGSDQDPNDPGTNSQLDEAPPAVRRNPPAPAATAPPRDPDADKKRTVLKEAAREPAAQKRGEASLKISHPDLAKDKLLPLRDEVTLLGEDGGTADSTQGRTYANQAYVLFIRTADGLLAASAGDRRLITVNGRPHLYKRVADGDTIELGLLSVVVQGG